MSIALGHAWLQKHPTPSASSGEFHWHGEGAATSDDAALRGRVVEEVQRLAAPAVWWELSPRRVIWAAVFSATSPTDARPYRGVALTVATTMTATEASDSMAALLAQLTVAPAAPWGSSTVPAAATAAAESRRGAHDAELARAVLSGGAATVEDPHDARWPAQLAQLVRRLPAALAARPVSGQLTDAATTMLAHDGGDAVAELLARVWRGAEGQAAAAAAWRLLCELAESDARASAATKAQRGEVLTALLDEILAESQRALDVRFSDRATRRFAKLLRPWSAHRAAAPTSWRQLLHGWGRGWLDEDSAPGAAILAEELALRALAELGRGGEAERVLAEARWQALLPAARRRALWSELARRAPSLAERAPFPRPSQRSQLESIDVA